MEKYSLGNTGKSYELKTEYIDYLPLKFDSWNDWYFDLAENKKGPLAIVNKEETKVEVIIISIITKDSFPMSVYSEERFNDWFRFMVIALGDTEPFIIPMHEKGEED